MARIVISNNSLKRGGDIPKGEKYFQPAGDIPEVDEYINAAKNKGIQPLPEQKGRK